MRDHRRKQRGQSFVEMALILPILILLVGGVIDLGRAFLILVATENAAGEGALYGISHQDCLTGACTGLASIEGRVIEEGKPFIALTVDDITWSIDQESGVDAGNTLLVTIHYEYSPLTPLGFLFWGDTAQVEATARQVLLSPPRPS